MQLLGGIQPNYWGDISPIPPPPPPPGFGTPAKEASQLDALEQYGQVRRV